MKNYSIDTQRLAVVTPVGRESETIESFIIAVRSNLAKEDSHILVTDKYTDIETKKIIESKCITEYPQVIWLDLPFSNGIASVYIAGYSYALKMNFTHFIEMDAGFSHDPTLLRLFKSESVNYDVVFGNRFSSHSVYQTTLKRKIISKGGSFLSRLVLGVKIKDMTSGYQLFSRKAITKILNHGIQSKGPFFQTEMKYLTTKFELSYHEIPISYSNPSHHITWKEIFNSLLALKRIAK